MKRRNAECGKLRRPLKRSKITEGIYGSTFLYLKFVLVWALVLMADFILEFRFEYLWPFWLLLRSVYDSFKYQGLAFSVFFVCIAVTSDVICYLLIPIQWLFFAASTYVWVQYVWHTERGICLPTVSLWLLFVYIEASVRLREFKSLPFHLDLCRPFAAHCIGYPVVTLGFGFKSYVSYRLRLRKQKDVQQENDFYFNLLTQALPVDQQNLDKAKAALPSKSQEDEISSHTANGDPQPPQSKKCSNKPIETEKELNKKQSNAPNIEDYIYTEQQQQLQQQGKQTDINTYDEDNFVNEQNAKAYKQTNGVAKHNKLNSQKDNSASVAAPVNVVAPPNKKGKSNNTANLYTPNNKDDLINRLESDIKRLKADLQSSRNCEQELRSQINTLMIGDKSMKSELYQLRQDNESLQTKLHNLVTSRQQDKQSLAALERKILDERKQRTALEQTLCNERKARKAEDSARALVMNTTRVECTEMCKSRRRELENEIKQIRREVHMREEQLRQLERETQSLRQYKEAQNETEVLMSALHAMQDKTHHLEKSLSAETKLKMDLFSALGDAKRQIEIQQALLMQRDSEIAELKAKIGEVMSLMPSTSSFTSLNCNSSPHFSATFTNKTPDVLSTSSLNPNASDYLPKPTH